MNKDNVLDAKISFRLRIEDNNGLRFLTEKGTEFVCMLGDMIQPKLRQNVVLMYSGHFHQLLKELLESNNVKCGFESLFQNFQFHSKDENNDDNKNDENKEDEILFEQLRPKLYKDFVSGAFNRYKANNLSLQI